MTSATRLASVLAALLVLGSPGVSPAIASRGEQQPSRAAIYVCPMHPDVSEAAPGACPRCGMTLVLVDPLAMLEYRFDVETSPQPVAGRPIRLTLTVRDANTTAIVRDFAVVHERRFHLFVLSQDLNHYDHVHPEQQPDGSFTLDITLPREGYYKLFADFLPEGGTPQVIPRTIVTQRFTGDLSSSMARLVPDDVLRKIAGHMSVQLTLPGSGLVAGRDEKFAYHLTDARTGQPVRDVEPYLGAWGHSLIMSEDTQHFVHAHPVEQLPEQAAAQGGPDLTFKAMLPKPGRYRIWTQIKRGGVVSTATFTVAVSSPSAQQ